MLFCAVMSHVVELQEWKNLMAQSTALRSRPLRDIFAGDPLRFQTFHKKIKGLLVDYSRQRLDRQTLNGLLACLSAQHFEKKRDDFFAGKKINTSENRAALHMALRAQASDVFMVDGANVVPDVLHERERAFALAEKIRAGQLMGATGKAITTVIHIGIGGSDLGPRFLVQALADTQSPHLHFVSNVDPGALQKVMRCCDPDRTIVAIASKTFTTAETMRNAQTVRDWLIEKLGAAGGLQHCLALTAAPGTAKAFGIAPGNIFRFWDWVGGRFSVHSVIGLPAMLAMGREAFQSFLNGARVMDAHFRSAPLAENIPVLLALMDSWNNNALGIFARAVLPYTEALAHFPEYVSQLEMESLGKNVSLEGVATPIVFGGTGTPAQHAFMQALHQGNTIAATDIFLAIKNEDNLPAHTHMLQANALAQAHALAFGKTDRLAYKSCPGNRPVTLFVMDDVSPFCLGQLVALFEHKIFTLGVLWDVNPFDQWGVELGKTLAGPIESLLNGDSHTAPEAVPSEILSLLGCFKK